MTELRRTQAAAGPVITGFSGRRIVIDGVAYDGAVILTPEKVTAWDGADFAAAAAIEPAPEFVLLGTGAELERPPADIVAALDERGIGVEAMDTRAAARAWTLLRAEGRWIAAALRAL